MASLLLLFFALSYQQCTLIFVHLASDSLALDQSNNLHHSNSDGMDIFHECLCSLLLSLENKLLTL